MGRNVGSGTSELPNAGGNEVIISAAPLRFWQEELGWCAGRLGGCRVSTEAPAVGPDE